MIKIYITTANTSAPLQVINQSAPQYFRIALITPIKAPPAINPEAINVPRSRRALFTFSSLLRVPTYQLTKPPINSGVFKSNGINIPRAKANAGTPIIVKINAKAAPAKYNNQGVAPPSIKGLITAAIAFACGATNAFSPTKP